LVAYLALLVTVCLGASSSAQLPIFQTPRPTPRPTPAPNPSASPQPQPQPTPRPNPQPTNPPGPSGDPGLLPPLSTPRASAPPGVSPKPAPGGPADPLGAPKSDEDAKLPEEFDIPVLRRTPPRNTVELVRLLEPLTQTGMTLTEVLVEGMGRFPVAGLAYYSDDWLNPRYTPEFHLHHGLDIFADFGTPIRSPEDGVVSKLSDGPTGGIGVWLRGRSGVSYYYAHLQDRVEGIHVGMPVQVGTVIGSVGDTGNAQGGAPHLHFEVHQPGAIPPKPFVDAWLDEAIELAPRWVDARIRELTNKRELLRTDRPSSSFGSDAATGTLETSLLLTFLDPVGGPVGLLPRLPLQPARVPPVSEQLVQEIVRLRVDGAVFGGHTFGVRAS
jgi:peptidoglycan LD-endopeptidase LytH